MQQVVELPHLPDTHVRDKLERIAKLSLESK